MKGEIRLGRYKNRDTNKQVNMFNSGEAYYYYLQGRPISMTEEIFRARWIKVESLPPVSRGGQLGNGNASKGGLLKQVTIRFKDIDEYRYVIENYDPEARALVLLGHIRVSDNPYKKENKK